MAKIHIFLYFTSWFFFFVWKPKPHPTVVRHVGWKNGIGFFFTMSVWGNMSNVNKLFLEKAREQKKHYFIIIYFIISLFNYFIRKWWEATEKNVMIIHWCFLIMHLFIQIPCEQKNSKKMSSHSFPSPLCDAASTSPGRALSNDGNEYHSIKRLPQTVTPPLAFSEKKNSWNSMPILDLRMECDVQLPMNSGPTDGIQPLGALYSRGVLQLEKMQSLPLVVWFCYRDHLFDLSCELMRELVRAVVRGLRHRFVCGFVWEFVRKLLREFVHKYVHENCKQIFAQICAQINARASLCMDLCAILCTNLCVDLRAINAWDCAWICVGISAQICVWICAGICARIWVQIQVCIQVRVQVGVHLWLSTKKMCKESKPKKRAL